MAANNVVEYSYDAAGNIKTIARQSIGGFAITSFDPASGPVGSTVTIHGAGFSATPSNNVVRFNGTSATVTASQAGSISATVPTGATTGRITVTVGANTATSATDFVVTVPGAPTITSFAPSIGAAGTSITVTGTNFSTTSGATAVALNGVAATSSIASDTSLSFSVPAAASSGQIAATTALGTGMSAQDLIVAPAGIAPADIVSTARLVPNGAGAPISLPATSKHGMVLFDGVTDGHYTVQFARYGSSPVIAPTNYKIIKPDGGTLATGTLGNYSSLRPTIHIPRLPAQGTYSILLSPGSATFDSMVRVVTDPVLEMDGPAAAVALDFEGQTARVVFNAVASQRLGIAFTGITYTPAPENNPFVAVYQPNGAVLGSLPSCSMLADACDWEIAPTASGWHSAIVSPSAVSAMTFTAQLASEVTGNVALDSGTDVTLALPGQDGRYTFAASAGDSVGIDLSGLATVPTARNVVLRVRNPGGTLMKEVAVQEPNGGYAELGTLSATGNYTIEVDSGIAASVSGRLQVKGGLLLTTASTPAIFSTAYVAESVRMRFNATAGDNLSVGLTGLAYTGTSSSSSTLAVYGPAGGSAVTTAQCWLTVAEGRCRVQLDSVSTTGVYSIVLRGPGGVKPAGDLLLSSTLSATLASGTPQAASTSRAGQAVQFTFSASAGDNLGLKLFDVSTVPNGQLPNFTLRQPNGTIVAANYAASSTTARWLEVASAPATGTYSLVVAPTYASTWSGTLLLDPGTALTMNGATGSPATSTAGEPLRYRFAATAGQRLEVGLSGLTYAAASASATALRVIAPNGAQPLVGTCTTSVGCEAAAPSLALAGAYTLWVLPPATSSITAGTLAISTPVTGTMVVGDPAQTVAISRLGQTARYTFNGTAAQLLRLNWASASLTGATSVWVTVLRPDGTTLSSGTFAHGANGGMDIATLPTTGSYTVVLDPNNGGTMSANLSLVIR